jgi:ankyrin repeat protein
MSKLYALIFIFLSTGQFVRSNNIDYKPFFNAAEKGDESALKAFLCSNPNADVNVKNERGSSVLMFAAYNGHKGIIRTLLSFDADINQADNLGNTPLIAASMNASKNKNCSDCAQLLLSSGANKEVRTNLQITASNVSKRGSDLNNALRLKNPFRVKSYRTFVMNESLAKYPGNVFRVLQNRELGARDFSRRSWLKSYKNKAE